VGCYGRREGKLNQEDGVLEIAQELHTVWLAAHLEASRAILRSLALVD